MADMTYHEAAAHEATALPVMLPGKLVGRDQTLAAVYGELKQNKPVLLYGPSGIGNTAIAATLASAYTQQPGGSLWLNIDQDSLAQLIVRVGRAYGDYGISNSENPLGMVGAASALLAQKKPLIVLDGDPLMPAVTEFVNKLAPGLPLMIVSDNDIPGLWQSVEVPQLAPKDAVTLFSEKSGLSTPEVADIVALLENTPFAIIMAAGTARIAKLSAADLLAQLKALDSAGSPSSRALTLGFGKLQASLQGILLLLGATFGGTASLEMMSMLSGAPAETTQKVMTILAASGFVQQDIRYGEPFYGMHPLAYGHAQAFLKSANRLSALQEKVRDAVLAYAQKYSTPDDRAHNKLSVEMDNFIATAHWAAQRGEGDISSQIVVSLTQAGDFIKSRGYLYELLQLKDAGSSGVSAFPANAELPPEAMIPDEDEYDEEEDFDDFDEYDEDEDFDEDEDLLEVGDELAAPEDLIPSAQVDLTDADSLRAAIAEARSQEDDDRALELQNTLGNLLLSQGNHDEALAIFNNILRIYEDRDDRENLLKTRLTVADLMVKQESSQAAVLHATQAARLAEELKRERDQATALKLVGDARQQLGESTDAILAYTHALDLVKSLGDRAAQAEIQMQLGFAQLDDDDPEVAIKTWDEALKLCREAGKRDCEGRILGGLGTAYGELQRWEEALNFHMSALYIAREVGDRQEEALQLSNLGYAAKQAGKLGDAVLRYRQALHLAYTLNERDNIVSTIVDLARMLVESPLHLNIAELLVNDAIERESSDREVIKLKERINNEKILAAAQGIEFKEVKGTAQEYAQSAYQLLNN